MSGAVDTPAPDSGITRLLQRWSGGDAEAFEQLVPIVYERMRQLAHQRLRREGGDRSLNTTALVHEAYLKLVESPQPVLRDRAHFLALASRVMRHLLVDRARARQAAKRGGGKVPLELAEDLWVSPIPLDEVEALDAALRELERLDPRQSQILEQRYFGGLSLEETAEAMGVSLATIKRELRCARAWLALRLREGSS